MITAQIKNCASKLIEQADQAVEAYSTNDPSPEKILLSEPPPAMWAQGAEDLVVMHELVSLHDAIKKGLDTHNSDRQRAIRDSGDTQAAGKLDRRIA